MSEVKRVFKVNGKPFFPIGAEGVFSGGYTVKQGEEEFPFKSLKAMHGNSIAIPVNWDQIEPVEGKFDFTSVDSLIANARKYDLRLILLWFATWKNAAMEFAPSWVKTIPNDLNGSLTLPVTNCGPSPRIVRLIWMPIKRHLWLCVNI